MKRFWLGVAAMALLSACGASDVFPLAPDLDGGTQDDGGDTSGDGNIVIDDTVQIAAPADIANEIDSVTFNPGDGSTPPTLSIGGAGFDVAGAPAEYVRKPGLDVPGFQAFTSQVDGDSRHYLAFVSEEDGIVAMAAGSGQFAQFLAGANFTRTGTYSEPLASSVPDLGSVTYTGTYVGILNRAGDQGDLLPPTGTSGNPVQIAEITGTTIVQADFSGDGGKNVIGGIFDRTVVDPIIDTDGDGTPDANAPVENLNFEITGLNEDGTFSGTVIKDDFTAVGGYAGAFAGQEATAVGGALKVNNHIDQLTDAPTTEYGAFTATR